MSSLSRLTYIENMKENKWDLVAKEILEQERLIYPFNNPKPNVAPKFAKEIVLLSKSSDPIDSDLANATRKLDRERIELRADNSLDLDGRQHVVRKLGNKITFMSSEQTKYIVDHPIKICELETM